ncbi:MAG: helix-turn-helix domain-containing protein [Gemmatimonadales bacterium]|jgi:predicted transcriptional regulator
MHVIDLTPFGFTPTESAAYSGLLAAGPSSGYGLARRLGIARANAYQALRGLVDKGAAVLAGREPQVYRAVQPKGLLAQIARDQESKLETLEQQLSTTDVTGAPSTTAFSGTRALYALALRSITRATGPVTCLGPPPVLVALLPIWRKRLADGAPTNLWSLGGDGRGLPLAVSGEISEARVMRHFGAPAAILVAEHCAAVSITQGDALEGLWSSDPVLMGLARAAVADLTGEA